MPSFQVTHTPQGKRLVMQHNDHGTEVDDACVNFIRNVAEHDGTVIVYDPESYEDTYICRVFNGGAQHNRTSYPGPVYVVADRQEFPWFEFHTRESLLQNFRQPDHTTC